MFIASVKNKNGCNSQTSKATDCASEQAADSSTDWLIDLYWFRALMVPIHLDLIDGPFLPHNLISTQRSPVPLLKCQKAPQT